MPLCRTNIMTLKEVKYKMEFNNKLRPDINGAYWSKLQKIYDALKTEIDPKKKSALEMQEQKILFEWKLYQKSKGKRQ